VQSSEAPIRLIVITGPIAAGKSTVSELLADRLAEAGRSAVVVELDDVAHMVRSPAAEARRLWDEAHRAHAALLAGWLSTSIEVVITPGPFITRFERETLRTAIPPATAVLEVRLNSTLATAFGRVEGDPTRGLSRDPTFLRSMYEHFDRTTDGEPAAGLTFDSVAEDPESIVSSILEHLRR
jgi:adenylylsulfate kinase-like enzyme